MWNHDSMGDDTLIEHYLRRDAGSEKAFHDLVSKYAGMVFGVAMRKTGQPELAEEIAQTVFTILARKANRIEAQSSIAGWLHRATMLESAKALRTQYRRSRKMKEYFEHETTHRDSAESQRLDDILPAVDEALHRLAIPDRNVILHVHFEGKSYREIAAETGTTEAACAKRSSRAMTRLRDALRKQGIIVSTTVLGTAIATQLAGIPPAEFVKGLAQASLKSTSATTSSVFGSPLLHAMASIKLTTITALVVAGASVPLAIKWAERAQSKPSEHSTSSPSPAGGSTASTLDLSPLVDIDLAALERALERLPQPELESKLAALMFTLTEREIPDVVALVIKAENHKALFSVARALFARWAEIDPRAAAVKAETIAQHGLRTGARSGALTGWLASDSHRALLFLEERLAVNDSADRQLEFKYPLAGWVERDPKAAVAETYRTIEDPMVRNKLVTGILRVWANTDSDAAIAWTRSLQDPELAREMQVAIIDKLRQTDPASAVRLAASMGFPDETVFNVGLALGKWSESDPSAAIEAYLQLPDSLRKAPMASRVAVEFARSDPERTLLIASKLPEGEERHQWMLFSAQQMANYDPVAAVPTVESLPESLQYRADVLREIADLWMRRQPEQAADWIRNSNHFDAQAQQELLSYEL